MDSAARMVIVLYFISFFFSVVYSIPYKPCPPSSKKEIRSLFVFTCDTRSGYKEFQALKVWNITSLRLRQNNRVFIVNVCKGKQWGQYGFLTKPLIYLDAIRRLPKINKNGGEIVVLLMDSDTFWSVENIDQMWNKYDCARENKDIVISTEMSCWIGRFCQSEDLNRFYPDIAHVPSYSPFLNSGVIMGNAVKVGIMLNYVIKNNQSYYIKYKKLKFDDQFAIADYALNIAPSEVALDYHQQLAASCSIHTVSDVPDTGWPFVCKSKQNRTLYPSCKDFTMKVLRSGYFKMDPSNCLVRRHITKWTPESTELETLAPDPIVWHGNGAGKRAFVTLAHNSYKCLLSRHSLSEEEYSESYHDM